MAAASAFAAPVLASSAAVAAHAREAQPADAGASGEVLSTLPMPARQTHALILSGGPFPYPRDGSVFVNRERQPPLHPRAYHRAYTVKTPGLDHRGARRIVCGGDQPTVPEACYYTADLDASLIRIVP